jgi:hypothetical protein
MGPTALLPLRRKVCGRFFFRPKNPTASAGCEPANLSTKGQHAASRAPKSFVSYKIAICRKDSRRREIECVIILEMRVRLTYLWVAGDCLRGCTAHRSWSECAGVIRLIATVPGCLPFVQASWNFILHVGGRVINVG